MKLNGAAHRMNPNNRMLGLDRFPADKLAVASAVLRLWETAMLRAEAVEKRLDGLGQPGIGCCLGCPCGVSARRGYGQESQDGDTRCLVLVGHIGMIADSAELITLIPSPVFIIRAEVDIVQLEVVLDMRSDRLGVRH